MRVIKLMRSTLCNGVNVASSACIAWYRIIIYRLIFSRHQPTLRTRPHLKSKLCSFADVNVFSPEDSNSLSISSLFSLRLYLPRPAA